MTSVTVQWFVQPEKLPPLPVLVARGKGWSYETLQKTLKSDPTAQARWDEIEALVREAIARSPANPAPKSETKEKAHV